ncbi:hypothetical protein Tcan_05305 [Toxocara canis]|uniref:Uncharacterized protein n=1 Tax=Toxocara canis TaxID=6265 RepID=A0A0B2W5I8_TOXCA|nr:hypothetical protein Tcan_05305 [Toxocara canis]
MTTAVSENETELAKECKTEDFGTVNNTGETPLKILNGLPMLETDQTFDNRFKNIKQHDAEADVETANEEKSEVNNSDTHSVPEQITPVVEDNPRFTLSNNRQDAETPVTHSKTIDQHAKEDQQSTMGDKSEPTLESIENTRVPPIKHENDYCTDI